MRTFLRFFTVIAIENSAALFIALSPLSAGG